MTPTALLHGKSHREIPRPRCPCLRIPHLERHAFLRALNAILDTWRLVPWNPFQRCPCPLETSRTPCVKRRGGENSKKKKSRVFDRRIFPGFTISTALFHVFQPGQSHVMIYPYPSETPDQWDLGDRPISDAKVGKQFEALILIMILAAFADISPLSRIEKLSSPGGWSELLPQAIMYTTTHPPPGSAGIHGPCPTTP